MSFIVEMSEFRGTLEELLEKVKKHEIDPLSIDLHAITEQLKKQVGEENQEYKDLSEALVSLSALLARKSKALLPLDEDEEEPDGASIDTASSEDFEKYAQLTMYLTELEEENGSTFTRQVVNRIEHEYDIKDYLGTVSLQDLGSALKEVLARFRQQQENLTFQEEVERPEYTVDQKISQILEHVGQVRKKKFTFSSFFSSAVSKLEIIVTFLAILELIKQKQIRVLQERAFGPIMIQRI